MVATLLINLCWLSSLEAFGVEVLRSLSSFFISPHLQLCFCRYRRYIPSHRPDLHIPALLYPAAATLLVASECGVSVNEIRQRQHSQ